MSTTVTYKGSTLTTVNNQTRTLKTAGKYMEGDVVLTDVTSSGGVPHVWQDQDGYVHLDDEGTTQIAVEALSVTQNGTYTASTGHAYSPVTVNVSGGGDHSAEDGIIGRNISGAYENSRVTTIGSYAFAFCRSLTTASFPNVTSIGSYAFYFCTTMTTASFSNATSIGVYAFANCSFLTTASFPSATSISSYAFCSCSSMTTASFPSATYIGSSAFANCSRLATVSFPNATFIGNYAFYSCSSLTTASFPSAKIFGNQVFRYCVKLESLYVLASSVATLGTSVFVNTPMSLSSYLGHFGSIYVPSSLVDAYKSAINWSTYSDRITSYVEA